MNLRLLPIPHRLALAVSVPVAALLIVVGLGVNARSDTARQAADELARIETLETLAKLQADNVLPDLADLHLRALAEGEGSFLIETLIGGFWEQTRADFVLADEVRAQTQTDGGQVTDAQVAADIAQAFDTQRQTVDDLSAAMAGQSELSAQLLAEAHQARLEADLALSRLADGSTSGVWMTLASAIDAERSAVIEDAYVMATLAGLKVADEYHLADIGAARTNAARLLAMSLDPDLQDRLQAASDSDANQEWGRAVTAAGTVAGGQAEPWSIIDVGGLAGPAVQRGEALDAMTAEAIEQVRSGLAAVETGATNERRALLGLTGLLLLITAGVTALVVQSVLSPLRRVTQRVSDLADGTLDGPRLDHGEHDALAELGNSIEDVAAGLQHLGQQFEAMADGDLDDPSLESAAPGVMGAFVQDWVREVSEAGDNLKAEATHDQLTGLLNRQGLAAHLGHMAGGPEIAVIYLDLDNFKLVNDVHGHRHGDAVLRVVARRLLGFVREDDPVCRLEGDQFVLLVTGVGRDDIPIFTSRVELGLSEPISFEGTVHTIGCSIGVGWLEPGDLLEPILQEADKRMLEAKANDEDRIPR